MMDLHFIFSRDLKSTSFTSIVLKKMNLTQPFLVVDYLTEHFSLTLTLFLFSSYEQRNLGGQNGDLG
jgi:cobalamin synthase